MRHRLPKIKKPQAMVLAALVLLACALTPACGGAIVPVTAVTPSAAQTPAVTPSPSPSPSPTPVPAPTPVPTPTPDPLDAIFAKQGQEIVEYKKDGAEIDPYAKGAPLPDYWLYNSYDLRVEITQTIDTKDRLTYYIADIRTRDGMRETAGFGSMKPPGFQRVRCAKFAREYGTVFAINGDYLTYKEKNLKGILIRDGKVYYEGKKEDTLAFFPDMSLKLFSPGETTAQELLDQGVLNTWSFGPTLVINGKLNDNMRNLRKINYELDPRCGIGMISPGHLIAIMVEGRIPESKGMKMNDFAQMFVDQGCSVAINLDGGASACFVFLGNMCNMTRDDGVTYGGPRPLVDMIMFGQSSLCPTVKDPYYTNGTVKVN